MSAVVAQPTEEAIPTAEDQARRLRNGLISLALLVAVVVGLLVAVPGLKGVATTVSNMEAGWLAVGVVLELLSCIGYVLAFMLVFDRAPLKLAARVAWTEMAFGAAVSLGGAGSAAVGAWLLHERGAPLPRVAERAAVLFLLTSAVNVIVLAIFGFGVGTGLLPGSSNPLLTYLPGAVALGALMFFLSLPKIMEGYLRTHKCGKIATLLDGVSVSIRNTRRTLVTPDWRLLGAIAYLMCDIGVLFVCLKATGHPALFPVVVLAYQIGYLSNIIPVPGNIGILDASLVGMLVLFGVSVTVATSAAVVYHAIVLWVPATIGTVAFIRLRQTAGEKVTLRPPRDERRANRAACKAARAELRREAEARRRAQLTQS